jgi:hypothetical protein
VEIGQSSSSFPHTHAPLKQGLVCFHFDSLVLLRDRCVAEERFPSSGFRKDAPSTKPFPGIYDLAPYISNGHAQKVLSASLISIQLVLYILFGAE